MPVTTHSIANYTVQVLTKKSGDHPTTSIIVRLYDEEDRNCGTAVFEDLAEHKPRTPIADYKGRRATVYCAMSYYGPFMDILRQERPLYWKVAWVRSGARWAVADVSLDTKKEILGEFFHRPKEAAKRK